MAYSKAYDDFKADYEHIDLSDIDNGDFIIKATNLNVRAEQAMLDAKTLEIDAKHNEDDLYNAYEKAYDYYKELYQCITDAMSAAERLSLKAVKLEKSQKWEKYIDRTIAVISVLIGIMGVIVGFFL